MKQDEDKNSLEDSQSQIIYTSPDGSEDLSVLSYFYRTLFETFHVLNQAFSLSPTQATILQIIQFVQIILMTATINAKESQWEPEMLHKIINGAGTVFIDPMEFLEAYDFIHVIIFVFVMFIPMVHMLIVILNIRSAFLESHFQGCYVISIALKLYSSIFMIPFLSIFHNRSQIYRCYNECI